MIVKRFISLSVVATFSATLLNAQAPLAPDTLTSGKPVERRIEAGESHSYQIPLKAGQFLRVAALQKQFDIVLVLFGPDGAKLMENDLSERLNKSEPLSFEAKSAGNYRLEVGAAKIDHFRQVAQTRLELRVSSEAKIIGDYRMADRWLLSRSSAGAYRLLAELTAAATAQDRKRALAELLMNEAAAMRWRMEIQPGLEKERQALALWRELNDRPSEADTAHSIGDSFTDLGGYEKAAGYYEQSLAIRRELKDRAGEAECLLDLGLAYDRLDNLERSLGNFTQALAIIRETKDRRGEVVGLRWIGWINYRLKRFEKAIEYSEQALAIARKMKNRQDESVAINNLAQAYWGLRQFEKAISHGQQFLALNRELKNRVGEATALQNLHFFHVGLFRFEKGSEYLVQALEIYRELKARKKEAQVLKNLGDAHMTITRLDKMVEYYERAVPIYRELNDRQGEAFALGPLANAYSQLGRQEKAIEYFERALSLNREVKSLRVVGNLNGLGNAYGEVGRYDKALEFYQESLSLSRSSNAASGFLAMVLTNIGETYLLMGQNEKAVEYLQESLVIHRETKLRGADAYTLVVLGDALRGQSNHAMATRHHEQALRLAQETKNRNLEAKSLLSLMLDWQEQNRPGLAVFYGKQAVNLYQEIRSEISKLEKESRQSFIRSKEGTYRALADLLITQGRLTEAEQVIRMLKDEEYFEFVRRDQDPASNGTKAQLTPEETAIEKRYREILEKLAELGIERGALVEKKSRTAEEEIRLAKLDADLVVAGNEFQKFLDGLAAALGTSAEAGVKVFQMRESQGLMEDLRELGNGAVALYTLIGVDKYRVILTTPDFQKGYEFPIKGADLNRKVLEFREVLQNPKLDPNPLSRELYTILLGPVEKDMARAKVRTIMWSLDGVLRYVPVAALNDGERYLVEKYQNVVFTPASQARLKDLPGRNWNVLGLGVTKAQGEGIPALPGVADEMRGIINDGATGTGVLPGTIKLDEQFTQEAMLAGLRQRPPVVHVASHFQFLPGNETNSALLLGDGTFLSLAQIKSLPNVFSGVELLTLSACNTATGGSGANGKEVEGFAVLAQRQGAKAVVASLWPVADQSTKVLMQDFYRLRQANPNTTKAEALRQAQNRLLRGETPLKAADPPVSADRQLVHEKAAKKVTFTRDLKKPYAHPYYWAPFILIGNWK